jgi:peroxiredoxin
MKKAFSILVLAFLFHLQGHAQRVENFELKDAVSGNMFSLQDHQAKRGVVLIFTSNTCPFSRLYEDRIIDLANRFSNDFQFALINPQVRASEEENEQSMRRKAAEKNFPMPYLVDSDQRISQALNASKLPEAFVITGGPTGNTVVYQGAIDNNPQAPGSVSQRHLENALLQIQRRSSPSPSSTRAVGCNIRQF